MTRVGEDIEKGELSCTVGGNVNCGRQYGDASSNKNRTIIWSSYPSYGYLSKGYRNTNLKRYLHPHVYGGCIYNSQGMEIAGSSQYGMNGQR